MTVEFHGAPNWQRFAETWAAILAAKEGLEVVPGSVRLELNNREEAKSCLTKKPTTESAAAG